MRRTVIFLLAVILALGTLGYATAELNAMEDQIVYEQEVLFGDPEVLAGRTAHIYYEGGPHLHWDTAYTFGAEPSYKTDFTLTQERPAVQDWDFGNCTIQSYQGGGNYFPNSSLELSSETPAGKMILNAAQQVPAGTSTPVTVTLSDYFDTIPMDIDINYVSESLSCWFNRTDLDPLQYDEPAFPLDEEMWQVFHEVFRFPVPEGTQWTLTLDRDLDGNLCGVSYALPDQPYADFLTAVNDSGLYLIPMYRSFRGETLEGDYRDGPGLYFVPWVSRQDMDSADALPDFRQARNIYPLSSSDRCVDFRSSEDGKTGFLLTAEPEDFQLSILDLESGALLNQISLTPVEAEPESLFFSYPGGYLMTLSGGRLALVDLAGSGRKVLDTEAGPGREFVQSLSSIPHELAMDWQDGVLVLINPSYSTDFAFWAAAYTEAGPAYVGKYHSSFQPFADNGYHFAVNNFYTPITLE